MNISISFSNDKPMYEQIKDAIKLAIFNGEAKNNEVLPSVRQLSRDLNVSMITTKRAYSDLENEGFIYSVSGKGTFIRITDLNAIKLVREKELLENFEMQVTDLFDVNTDKDKLTKIIERVYEGDKNE